MSQARVERHASHFLAMCVAVVTITAASIAVAPGSAGQTLPSSVLASSVVLAKSQPEVKPSLTVRLDREAAPAFREVTMFGRAKGLPRITLKASTHQATWMSKVKLFGKARGLSKLMKLRLQRMTNTGVWSTIRGPRIRRDGTFRTSVLALAGPRKIRILAPSRKGRPRAVSPTLIITGLEHPLVGGWADLWWDGYQEQVRFNAASGDETPVPVLANFQRFESGAWQTLAVKSLEPGSREMIQFEPKADLPRLRVVFPATSRTQSKIDNLIWPSPPVDQSIEINGPAKEIASRDESTPAATFSIAGLAGDDFRPVVSAGGVTLVLRGPDGRIVPQRDLATRWVLPVSGTYRLTAYTLMPYPIDLQLVRSEWAGIEVGGPAVPVGREAMLGFSASSGSVVRISTSDGCHIGLTSVQAESENGIDPLPPTDDLFVIPFQGLNVLSVTQCAQPTSSWAQVTSVDLMRGEQTAKWQTLDLADGDVPDALVYGSDRQDFIFAEWERGDFDVWISLWGAVLDRSRSSNGKEFHATAPGGDGGALAFVARPGGPTTVRARLCTSVSTAVEIGAPAVVIDRRGCPPRFMLIHFTAAEGDTPVLESSEPTNACGLYRKGDPVLAPRSCGDTSGLAAGEWVMWLRTPDTGALFQARLVG